ncbi:DUF4153 domain-containing protein [Phytohabitans aurantiacus]|uniref:DUF4173 domain-containing protein n=1 Tax=Phytohabitans aurantiacus TaxID=3016789 RepID=A0ABQ5RAF9_9ACTN|nr:DUF4173 domain-containing protein [Phytohabitans aurantiacus]GLI03744.1 hypothetical protein Pa4123_90240 [Phytohabitans aurantiacus]
MTAPPKRPAPPPTQPPPAVAPGAQPWQPVLGPRPPTPFEKRWPGPLRSAPALALGAAAATGVVAAASVPLDRPGIGWLVTALTATTALVTLSRRHFPGRLQPLWTAATVTLIGLGTIRAAGWLFLLCLLAAAVTASLAVTPAHGFRSIFAASGTIPVAVLRATPWAWHALRALRHKRRSAPNVRVVAAVAMTVLLVVVFGALFAGADAAFAELVGRLVPEADIAVHMDKVWLFLFGAAAVIGAAYLLAGPPSFADLEKPAKAKLHRLEWTLPLAALNVVFAVFVAVQIAVLFGGEKHVLSTAGLTYAEYARKGFWQLLVVTALTLAILAAAARWAPRELRGDRVLVRVLLGGLAALCLVIVASALYRMHTYEEAYGFTRLRVLVSVCELWLGVVLAMVLTAGIRLRAGWLPRAVVGSAVAALIGLAALNPDRFIAERNVERHEQTGKIDTAYLSGLSADAAPALEELPAPLRGCALQEIAHDLALKPDGWREWNLGRREAREVVAAIPAANLTWNSACGPAWSRY